MLSSVLEAIEGFSWDYANVRKSLIKHDVSAKEAETIFVNHPIIIALDEKHSSQEIRYRALGKTHEDRKLFIAFTIRSKKIRIISARPMSRKERKAYEQEKDKT